MKHTVFAHHAHVFPKAIKPEGTIDQLRHLMEACEIDEAVCFAPFGYQTDGSDVADGNQWLADQLKTLSNLHGFGTLDLQRSDIKAQVSQIHSLGFKGIKLHPAAQKFNIMSPEAFIAYEAAQEHGLFLTFHTGIHWHRIKDYQVALFDEIAHHFPSLRFSLEHVGGYHFFQEALAVIVNNFKDHDQPLPESNVFAGLTSVFTRHMNRFWYLSPDRLEELIAQAGVRHLIFGLDFPYNGISETKLGLEVIRQLPVSDEEKAMILGGNLRRELGL